MGYYSLSFLLAIMQRSIAEFFGFATQPKEKENESSHDEPVRKSSGL